MAKSTATKTAGTKRPGVKKAASKKTASKKSGTTSKSPAKKAAPRKWSKEVNETSDAMDLKEGIFESKSPKKIAESLKQSATNSKRRKASPFQSAMSMLNFYINRGGENIPASQKKILEKAKSELRKLFGKEEE